MIPWEDPRAQPVTTLTAGIDYRERTEHSEHREKAHEMKSRDTRHNCRESFPSGHVTCFVPTESGDKCDVSWPEMHVRPGAWHFHQVSACHAQQLQTAGRKQVLYTRAVPNCTEHAVWAARACELLPGQGESPPGPGNHLPGQFLDAGRGSQWPAG